MDILINFNLLLLCHHCFVYLLCDISTINLQVIGRKGIKETVLRASFCFIDYHYNNLEIKLYCLLSYGNFTASFFIWVEYGMLNSKNILHFIIYKWVY
jgi:hypothetical protein